MKKDKKNKQKIMIISIFKTIFLLFINYFIQIISIDESIESIYKEKSNK